MIYLIFTDVKRAIELLEKLQKSNKSTILSLLLNQSLTICIFCLAGEVPVTKLAALQKVLQSDFLASVREVYEHVYETVDIQGSQVHNI